MYLDDDEILARELQAQETRKSRLNNNDTLTNDEYLARLLQDSENIEAPSIKRNDNMSKLSDHSQLQRDTELAMRLQMEEENNKSSK